MFEFIMGHFVSRDPGGRLILFNSKQGIAYQVQALNCDWCDIDEKTGEIQVFVRATFNETTGYTLFGFEDPLDRRAFDVLCKAQGVGGKMAMSILNQMSIEDLATATLDTFKPIKGVGPKVAGKILPELPALADLVASGAKAIDGPSDKVVVALVALGFPRDKALAAVRKAMDTHQGGDQTALLRAATALLHR